LIDKKGYVKLTDFGLSRILANNDETAMSVCGTPEYLAPEIIEKQGHGVMVDYWCLGCLIMEMVTGHPPF
jgi:serine/threonine protein kinase